MGQSRLWLGVGASRRFSGVGLRGGAGWASLCSVVNWKGDPGFGARVPFLIVFGWCVLEAEAAACSEHFSF